MSPIEEIKALDVQIEELKQKRAKLYQDVPPEAVSEYQFASPDGKAVSLGELFGSHPDLLAVHNMGRGCVYCTLWADGFTGFTPHLLDRTAFVLVSPDPPDVLKEFSESRKWNFPRVSMNGNSFAKDLGFHSEEGYWPGVSAFRRNDDGTIVRTGKAIFGPGDDFCSVWPFLDLLKGGPSGWEPKYKYG